VSFSGFDPTQTSIEARFAKPLTGTRCRAEILDCSATTFLRASFELRDQGRQGLGLLARREVTTG
jgi:hypothetical protein